MRPCLSLAFDPRPRHSSHDLKNSPSRSPGHAHAVALASAVFFAIVAALARAVSSHIPGPQVAFLRFATGVVVTLVAVLLAHVDLRPRNWG